MLELKEELLAIEKNEPPYIHWHGCRGVFRFSKKYIFLQINIVNFSWILRS